MIEWLQTKGMELYTSSTGTEERASENSESEDEDE